MHVMMPCLHLTGSVGRVESDMEQEDDDAEYYRQEVGEEPDPGICVRALVGC